MASGWVWGKVREVSGRRLKREAIATCIGHKGFAFEAKVPVDGWSPLPSFCPVGVDENGVFLVAAPDMWNVLDENGGFRRAVAECRILNDQ